MFEMKKIAKGPILPIFILSSCVFLVYSKYLFFQYGYPGFGNFFIPADKAALGWNIFWGPHAYDGIVGTTPMSGAINLVVYNVPIFLLSSVFNIYFAGRLYLVLGTIFFDISFYYLSGAFTRNTAIRLASSLFYLFNPINYMILGTGDVPSLIYLGFAIISYRLLANSFHEPHKILNKFFLLSVAFLVISIASYQVFFLGIFVYIFLIVYYSISNSINFGQFIKNVIAIPASFLLIAILILPEIYPLFVGGLAGTYIFSPGLGNYISNSSSLLNVLTLKGYPPNFTWVTISSFGYPLFTNTWTILEFLFMIALLVFPIFGKNKKFLIFSFAVVLGSLLGSGALSPIAQFNEYLYLHLPGYEAINASYFWDWIVLSLFYSILLILMLQTLFKNFKKIEHLSVEKHYFTKRNAIPKLLVVFSVLILIVPPVVSQSYYDIGSLQNTWGKSTPAYIPSLQVEVTKLVNGTDAGVAIFNPDMNLYIGNKSSNFVNPLMLDPASRTAELGYYGSPNVPSERYFLYAYRLFYQNETEDLGALMALAGIQYFVYMKNVSSYSYNGTFIPWTQGVNVEKQMSYQKHVIQLVNNPDYTIYKNLDFLGTVDRMNNLTLLTGGLPELATILSDGFNLSSYNIISPQDLSTFGNVFFENYTSNIFLSDTNSMYGIVLEPSNYSFDMGSFNLYSSPSYGWASSDTIPPNGPILADTMNPFIISYSKSTVQVPSSVIKSGNNSLWMEVYMNDQRSYGEHGIYVNSTSFSYYINTSSFDGLTNSFIWLKVPFTINNSNPISITSIGRINALKGIFVTPTGYVSKSMANLQKSILFHEIKVFIDTPGYYLASSNNISKMQNFDYTIAGGGGSPLGGVYLTNATGNPNGISLKVPPNSNSVLIQLYAAASSILDVKIGNKSTIFGIDTHHNSPLNATKTGYVELPVNGANSSNLTLSPQSGTLYLKSIIWLPNSLSTPPLVKTTAMIQTLNYSSYSSHPQYILYQNLSATKTGDTIHLHGSIDAVNTTPGETLLSYNLANQFNYTSNHEYSFSVSSGLLIDVNSFFMAGSTNNNSKIEVSNRLIGVYDVASRVGMYLTIISMGLSSEISGEFYLNVTTNISTPLSSFYSGNNSIYERISLGQTGYSINNNNNSGHSIVNDRLPFYSLMTVNGQQTKYLSGLYGLNTIFILNQNTEKVVVSVSYLNMEYMLIGIDLSTITLFLLVTLYLRRLGGRKDGR